MLPPHLMQQAVTFNVFIAFFFMSLYLLFVKDSTFKFHYRKTSDKTRHNTAKQDKQKYKNVCEKTNTFYFEEEFAAKTFD